MATFSGSENFESYTSGTDLNTLNGGSGWSNAWSGPLSGQGVKTILADNGSPGQGLICAKSTSGTFGGCAYSRTPTTVPSGTSTIIHCMIWISSSLSVSDVIIDFGTVQDASGNGYCIFQLDSSGTATISILGTIVTVATGLSQSTWYHAYIDIDVTNGRARGYISTTIPHTSVVWSSYATHAVSNHDTFNIQVNDNHSGASYTMQWDDLRDGAADFLPLPTTGAMLAVMG